MPNPLIINQTEIIHVIQHNEILYCEADRSYCHIHLIGGEKITNSRTLSTLYAQLNGQFIRISQSIIVNKLHIRKVIKKTKLVELFNGKKLPYSLKQVDLVKYFLSHTMQDEMA